MLKINGIYLPTFLKMRAWERIRKTKPSLKEIISMIEMMIQCKQNVVL